MAFTPRIAGNVVDGKVLLGQMPDVGIDYYPITTGNHDWWLDLENILVGGCSL